MGLFSEPWGRMFPALLAQVSENGPLRSTSRHSTCICDEHVTKLGSFITRLICNNYNYWYCNGSLYDMKLKTRTHDQLKHSGTALGAYSSPPIVRICRFSDRIAFVGVLEFFMECQGLGEGN